MKDVLRNFAKFTGKHLCQGLFFSKVEKRDTGTGVSCEFCKISKNTFFTQDLRTTDSENVSRVKYMVHFNIITFKLVDVLKTFISC